MRSVSKYLVAVVFVFVAIILIVQMWNFYMLGPWTRDCRIRAEIIQVPSQVSGQLMKLHIEDNQLVKKGDVLFEIDDADYIIKLETAQAQLKQVEAQRILAEEQLHRSQELFKKEITSKNALEIAQANYDDLSNREKQAEVALDKAELDLERTKVYAEVDGYITNLNVRPGNFISAGQSIMALVDRNSFYAVGYFEETKMRWVEEGKKVEIIPYYSSQKHKGRITGYSRAIVDQSASTGSQLIQNVQPNYPWVSLAQRIPVRVALEKTDSPYDLIAGSTCTITIVE